MNPFKIFRRNQEKRNMAMAKSQTGAFSFGLNDAGYSSYSVAKAVKEGMKENSWVYRCVSLITQNAASVPWYVYRDEEIQENHPLNTAFRKPNPHVSRQDFMELMSAWLQLAGNAYAYKTRGNQGTRELWPASPDRITPVPGRAIDEWISGYYFDRHKTSEQKYDPEEILHVKLINPANPIMGLSPLEAGGKAIDTDNEMRNFSYKTMKNNGRVEGVFMFKREFANLDEAEKVRHKLNEIYGGGRGFAVLGGEANYKQVASNMAELDFVNGRKFSREEIAIIFGVPIQLLSQESSTYNNFSTAELILWTLTIIPLLDNFADAFTMSFSDELADNEVIGYDASNVPALRRAMLDRAETATMLHDMGVPVEEINRIFELGINEYPGWAMSLPQNQQPMQQQRSEGHRVKVNAEGLKPHLESLTFDVLDNLREQAFNSIDKNDDE